MVDFIKSGKLLTDIFPLLFFKDDFFAREREYEREREKALEKECKKPTAKDRELYSAALDVAKSIPPISAPLHFRFDRTLTGEQLAQALRESLVQNGVDPEQVMVRYFDKKRLDHALRTGSDRDRLSRADYHGSIENGGDGESEWMSALGLSQDSVTYIAPLPKRLTGGADAPAAHNYIYVIYDRRCMYKLGRESNGFHAFLVKPKTACIGLMSDEGSLELAKVFRPNMDDRPNPSVQKDSQPS